MPKKTKTFGVTAILAALSGIGPAPELLDPVREHLDPELSGHHVLARDLDHGVLFEARRLVGVLSYRTG
jgi:hypothetical protein